MKKLLLPVLALAVIAVMVQTASAQATIDLGKSTSGLIQFLALGSNGSSVELNTCSKVHNGVCTSGGLQGSGSSLGFGGVSGFYTITGGGITGTLNSSGCTTCVWTLTGPALNFAFGTSPGGNNLLQGTFTLHSLTQTTNANGASFNQALEVNFTATGGSLKSYFDGGQGTISIDVQFTTAKSLLTLPKGASRFGWVAEGDVTANPEPGTMALLGSGILIVGGLLRRKFGA
jgi:hypothetical protein